MNNSLKSASPFDMSTADYQAFCTRLESESGIQLNTDKQYLVFSRLRSIMAESNMSNMSQLLSSMSRSESLTHRVVDALTVNETFWFRDDHPYRILREVIFPELAQLSRPSQIWSAACSTGQELYSIRIEEAEYRRTHPQKWHQSLHLLATDISSRVLKQAKEGSYSSLAMQRGMPKDKLNRYFKAAGDQWQVNTQLQANNEFRLFNLHHSFSPMGRFDVIFCRNVLIYFSQERKKAVLTSMHSALRPGGYLLLGGSEVIHGLNDLYETLHCRPGILYRAKAVAA
ncbi:MAG: protein-glutamate O-methyltransferase CheR [Oleibacter sp.]|nr:protein-glutamate O-methyltransferase CheR [Thalassolituus sp.]